MYTSLPSSPSPLHSILTFPFPHHSIVPSHTHISSALIIIVSPQSRRSSSSTGMRSGFSSSRFFCIKELLVYVIGEHRFSFGCLAWWGVCEREGRACMYAYNNARTQVDSMMAWVGVRQHTDCDCGQQSSQWSTLYWPGWVR